jgi:hypothetical protein
MISALRAFDGVSLFVPGYTLGLINGRKENGELGIAWSFCMVGAWDLLFDGFGWWEREKKGRK